jgi:hypothetical protein
MAPHANMASNMRYRAALARLDGSSCTDRANTGRAVEGSTDKRGTDRANTGRAVELTKIMLAVIEHTTRTNQAFHNDHETYEHTQTNQEMHH